MANMQRTPVLILLKRPIHSRDIQYATQCQYYILAGWKEFVLLNVELKMNRLAMYLRKYRVIKSAVGWESREWLDLPFQSGPRGFSMSDCGILGRRAKWKFNYWIPAHATDTQPSLGEGVHKGTIYVVLLGDNAWASEIWMEYYCMGGSDW